MRGALASKLLPWETAVAGLLVIVAYGLVFAQAKTLVFIAVALAVVLAVWLPPHAFLAVSLALLVTFQLSADHPVQLGGVAVYTTDLLLVLVLLRALTPWPRRHVDWSILGAPAAAVLLLWAVVMAVAAARGYLAGTPVKSIVRLGEQLFYYPILAWGFVRVLRERGVSSSRVVRALAWTALTFVGYMAFERLLHQRFENPNSATGHLGSVITAQGVTLHRDYGFYSAYDLYGLAALGALACLLFARPARGIIVALAGIFITAAALTLVRGIIFGSVVGAALLLVLAFRRRRLPGSRLLLLFAFLAIGVGVLWTVSPTSAQGVTERFLPGVTAQSSAATLTADYRLQALSLGYHHANAHPVGTGLVTPTPTDQGLLEQGYLAHSAWATVLVYTGWLGLLAFLAAVILLIRRSFQLPDASGWLQPFFLAASALLLVEGFGSDSIFGQPWVLGEAALVIGIRFGLADLDD